MGEVVCFCLNCKEELGTFKNSWNGIGSTYYSPLFPPSKGDYGLETTGDVYQAAPESPVENSVLQDLACRSCKTVLGLRCDSAPENHLLRDQQLLLRLAHMSVISKDTRQNAVVDVKEKFALTLPGTKKPSTPRRAPTEQTSIRFQSPSIAAKPSANGNGTMPPPPTPTQNQDKIQRDLKKFKEWAENAIALQQQDIDRIGGVVDRIEKGMKSFRDFMGQVRTDIAITRQESLTDDDLMLVRKDLNGFRDELATHNQQQAEINARMTAPDVSAHEFHTLSTDVQKVNHKASQVDNLKSELNYLKSRLEILESKALSPLNINEDEVFLSIGTPAPDKIWASKKSDESSGGPARQLISNWTSLHEHAGLDHELDAALPKLPKYVGPTNAKIPVQEIFDSQDSISSRGPSFQGFPTTEEAVPARTESAVEALPKTPTMSLVEISPKKPDARERWTYTGSQHHHSLAKACHAFGLEYSGKSTAVKSIEKFVNSNHLFHTADAKKYGKVIIKQKKKTGESIYQDQNLQREQSASTPQVESNNATPLLRKRQHNEGEEPSQKRRKQSSGYARDPSRVVEDSESEKLQELDSSVPLQADSVTIGTVSQDQVEVIEPSTTEAEDSDRRQPIVKAIAKKTQKAKYDSSKKAPGLHQSVEIPEVVKATVEKPKKTEPDRTKPSRKMPEKILKPSSASSKTVKKSSNSTPKNPTPIKAPEPELRSPSAPISKTRAPRKSDTESANQPRDANGNLLTPARKIDKRSLRYKGSKESLNERFDMAETSRPSTAEGGSRLSVVIPKMKTSDPST